MYSDDMLAFVYAATLFDQSIAISSLPQCIQLNHLAAYPNAMAKQPGSNGSSTTTPFYNTVHTITPGTAKKLDANTPNLFRPLRIRGIQLRNRICVSPMCQYSCAPTGPQQGALTPLYLAIIGHYAYKGAALIMLEATGVQPSGRISVNCPGLYNDIQTQAVQHLADFVHSQGGILGVQLSHGGRKASTLAPWIATERGQASAKAQPWERGWPSEVVARRGGPSHTFDGSARNDPTGGYHEAREITKGEIAEVITNFAQSAKRAVAAGVDVVEIHAAHGYLLHQFLSPITSRRTDEYGGNFENRIRLVVEIVQAVRATIPNMMPLFLRTSATDWMEGTDVAKRLGSWDLDSMIRLASLLPDLGVDVLDVSSAGNIKEASHTVFDAGREQAQFAATIRRHIKALGKNLLIGTVGEITGAKQAQDLVQDVSRQATCDLVSVGRQFLRDGAWVLRAAEELGVDVAWPTQIARPQVQGQVIASKL